MPSTPVLSTMTLPTGTVYQFKDLTARQLIEDLTGAVSGAVHYVDETTTPLTDGATTSPITVDGKSYTPHAGDVVAYGETEFIWSETSHKWREFGSTGSIKALAFKDSASGTFTPAGTVSQPTFTGTEKQVSVKGTPTGSVAVQLNIALSKTNVTPIDAVGTLPSLQFSVSGENLSISWDAGTLPTKGAAVSVATDVGTATASATFTGNELTSTGAHTPEGTVSQPTFTGSQGNVAVS